MEIANMKITTKIVIWNPNHVEYAPPQKKKKKKIRSLLTLQAYAHSACDVTRGSELVYILLISHWKNIVLGGAQQAEKFEENCEEY